MGNKSIPNRAKWFFTDFDKNGILHDKERLVSSYIAYMLSRTQRIFQYKGLPDTIPQRELERILQTSSFVIWCKDKEGKLYVMWGGLGGLPNPYYQPTYGIVANPSLKFYEQINFDDLKGEKGNGVLMWNDSSHIGLLPMFDRNASLLAECDISIRVVTVLYRIPAFFKSLNDTTKESIEKMLNDIEVGKLAVVGDDTDILTNDGVSLVEKFNERPFGALKELVETRQYMLGSWYNELGLNANFNMKREAINESEADMNEDALLPLIDDMLESRRSALDEVNKMFGTNITVDFTSSWKKIREEITDNVEKAKEEVEKRNDENNDEKEDQ